MEEKKGSKAGILVLVSVFLLVSLGALGYYIYRLKQDNEYLMSQSDLLQTQVEVMSNAIEKIQGTVDNVSNTNMVNEANNNVNTNTPITETIPEKKALSGTYVGDGDFFSDAPVYEFSEDGKVALAGIDTTYGYYTIEGNRLILHYTEWADPEGNRTNYNTEEISELKIKDDNTLVTEARDGSDYEYLKDIDPTMELICGKWIVSDKTRFASGDYEKYYVILNEDKTFDYYLLSRNKETKEEEEIKKSGTFELRDKNIILKSDGDNIELKFSRGKYLFTDVNYILEKE